MRKACDVFKFIVFEIPGVPGSVWTVDSEENCVNIGEL